MYYIYSRHASRISAEIALENYFANGEVSYGEYPRIKYERRLGWQIQIWDGSDGTIPPLKDRIG